MSDKIPMISNPTPEEIMRLIADETKGCHDLVRSAEELPIEINENGAMNFWLESGKYPCGQEVNERYARATHSAEQQLLARIDVPSQFFNKRSVDLRRRIMAECYVKRRFMFRCRPVRAGGFEGGMETIRAVLGPRYPTHRDDIHLFPIVLEALGADDISLRAFTKEDHVTELLANFSDTKTKWRDTDITGSLSITNSETGHSSLWIEPSIQIANGIWIGNRFGDGHVSARYVHRGALPTPEELREDIENAKRVVQIGIIQYLEACEQRVSSVEAVKYMENLAILPKRFAGIIAADIMESEFIMKTELIRRIVLATQHLPLIQTLQIRREVGGYVGLFEKTASRMATFAQEME